MAIPAAAAAAIKILGPMFTQQAVQVLQGGKGGKGAVTGKNRQKIIHQLALDSLSRRDKYAPNKVKEKEEYIGLLYPEQEQTTLSDKEKKQQMEKVYKQARKEAKEQTLGYGFRLLDLGTSTLGRGIESAGDLAGKLEGTKYDALAAAAASAAPTDTQRFMGMGDITPALQAAGQGYGNVVKQLGADAGQIMGNLVSGLGAELRDMKAEQKMNQNYNARAQQAAELDLTPSQAQLLGRGVSSDRATYQQSAKDRRERRGAG